MSIDKPTTALDHALGAEERAIERVCELEDTLSTQSELVKHLQAKYAALEFEFDRAFLDWCADRMVYAYGEDPGADFVLKLRNPPECLSAAAAKLLLEAASRIETLQGEAGVLRGLLRECLQVFDVMGAYDEGDFDRVVDLEEKIAAAIVGRV